MSRRLPRVRKVLSYNKGNGGDLEVAMDALGPSADSPDELRRIFILGVTAHLAGYSTHRDGKGDHHLIRFMEQHPVARQLAEEILGVGGAYPPTLEVGAGHRPSIQKRAATASAHTPKSGSPRRNVGSNDHGDTPAVREDTPPAHVKATPAVVSASGSNPIAKDVLAIEAQVAKKSSSHDKPLPAPEVPQPAVKMETEHAAGSAQFGAVSPGETAEGQKNLPNEDVVQKKVVGNQPEIGPAKTVSNLTIEGTALTVSQEGEGVNAMTTDRNEADASDSVDEEARNAAAELLDRAMQDF